MFISAKDAAARLALRKSAEFKDMFPEVVRWWNEDTSYAANTLRGAFDKRGALTERQLRAARRSARTFARAKLAASRVAP